MNITSGDHISRSIKQIASSATGPIYYASAFLRSAAFSRHFSDLTDHKSKKILVVRWRLSDFIYGASDLEAYPLARDLGWDFYMNPYLHAKALLSDDRAIISSANMTDKGMSGFPPQGNHELGVQIKGDAVTPLQSWFSQIIDNSRLMDDDLFQQISIETQAHLEDHPTKDTQDLRFSSATQSLIDSRPNYRLYTQDMLWTSSPSELYKLSQAPNARKFVEHDIMLLRLNRPINQQAVAEAFVLSPAFRWLKRQLSSEMYFGALTAALHNDLADDPAPYRQEIKGLLSNLLNWASELSPDQIHIDKPNHSQRVTLVDM